MGRSHESEAAACSLLIAVALLPALSSLMRSTTTNLPPKGVRSVESGVAMFEVRRWPTNQFERVRFLALFEARHWRMTQLD
jgi:hypothetical protein